jgi:hypothetical protein
LGFVLAVITIVPEGGLCNRMRSIAAAHILARRAEQPLRVAWYRTPQLNARFETLFELADAPFEVTDRWAMIPVMRTGMRAIEAVWARIGGPVVSRWEAVPDHFDLEATTAAARRGDVHIRSFAKFLSEPDMFEVFTPQPKIQRKLDALSERLEGAVSVHIRRTDNAKSIERSPMSAFFALMDRELERDDDTQFFVATDSRDAYRELASRYGERIFEHAKVSLRRDDPAAIEDAVVDLYALGSCRKIIGSYWSSFTDTAAELRGIERVLATPENAELTS